jgi:hypothetical protein
MAPLRYYAKREIGSTKSSDIEEYLIVEFGLRLAEARELTLPQVAYLMKLRHEIRTATTDLQRERVLVDLWGEQLQLDMHDPEWSQRSPSFTKALSVFPPPPGTMGEILTRHGLWDDVERTFKRLTEENRPQWDSATRKVTYQGIVCRRYRRTAHNQFLILDQFQAEGWPPTTRNPFRDEFQLKQTVKDFNNGLEQGSPLYLTIENRQAKWAIRQPRG